MFAKKFKLLLAVLAVFFLLKGTLIEDEPSPDQCLPPFFGEKLVLLRDDPFLRSRKSFLPKPAFILKSSKTSILPELQFGTIGNISLNILENVSLSFNNKVYPNDPLKDPVSNFDLKQNMKLNLNGVVGERLNILIKYDDTSQDAFSIDKNISLKYMGKEGEFLKTIEAGNINLAVPNTQFVSYSKNFFGIKGHLLFEGIPLIPGKLQMYPIVGYSDSQSLAKTWTKNASTTRKEISDSGYAKNSIFALYRGAAPSQSAWDDLIFNFFGKYRIVANSEALFYDDRITTNNTISTNNCGPLQNGIQIWNFDQLLRGEDYYVDVLNGILYLNRTVAETGLLAGAFEVEEIVTGTKTKIGDPFAPFKDIDMDGMISEDPGAGTDDDGDGLVDEDPIDGLDDDGDGQIDEDPGDFWYEGASTDDLDTDGNTESYFGNARFLKHEQNRYTGNALMNFYKTGITGIPFDDVSVSIMNRNDSDGDNDPAVFTTSEGKKVSYLTIFGLDLNPIDGTIDRGYLDTDIGILYFPDATPFDLSDNDTVSGYLKTVADELGLSGAELTEIVSKCSNRPIYAKNDSLADPFTTSRSIFYIALDYVSVAKIYSLDAMNIKENSEVVKVDGNILKKGRDYTIDYNAGIITFINENLIIGDAKIEVNYEYTPLISSQQKYVFGNRMEWNISKNFFIGSTVIDEEFMERDEIPDPGEESQSKFVLDFDTSLKITSEFLQKTLFALPGLNFLKPKDISLSAEYAYSYNNPNKFGKAALDAMEGTKQSEGPSLYPYKSWYLCSKPGIITDQSTRAATISVEESDSEFHSPGNEFSFYSFQDGDSHPYTPDETEIYQTFTAYSMLFDLKKAGTWGGITARSNISDISQKSSLDFWVKNLGDAADATIHIDLGLISEDADGDGTLDTEDADLNGRLNTDEDTGIIFNNGYFTAVLGPGDNYLQTEDFDFDGILDTIDRYYSYKSEILKTKSDDDGWQFISIPLNIDAGTADKYGNPTPNNVKYIRVWIEGSDANISFKMQELKISGNRWDKGIVENGTAGEYFAVSSVSVDDPSFSGFFVSGEQTDKEALMTDFYLIGTSSDIRTGYTKSVKSQALNISNYGYLELSVLGYDMPDTDAYSVYLKMGIDENNYWKIPLSVKKGYDSSDWVVNSIPVAGLSSYETVGNPSTLNVKYMALCIEAEAVVSGKFLFNNILLSEPKILKGTAYRANVSTDLGFFGPVAVNYSSVGSDFSPLGNNRTGTDQEALSATMNFSKLQWLPVNISYSRNTSELKDILDLSGTSSTTRSLSESIRFNTTLNLGTILWKFLPAINYSYSQSWSKSYGLYEGDELLKGKTLSEIHTMTMRMKSILFLIENMNLALGRNITLSENNPLFNTSASNPRTFRNNGTLSFTIKYLNLQNTLDYNESYQSGFKQNDNASYSITANVNLLRNILQPTVTLRGTLARVYYGDAVSSEAAYSSAKFTLNMSFKNRLMLGMLLRRVKILGLSTINLNISYDRSNATDIPEFDGVFGIIDSLDIVSGNLAPELYANQSDQERWNIALSYNPFKFLSLSGSYSYRQSDTSKLGTTTTEFNHSVNSSAMITQLDKLFKFLKRTSITLGMNYSLTEKADALYRNETFTPSLSFPISYSDVLTQSIRVSYNQNTDTRFGYDRTFSGTLSLATSLSYRLQLKYGIKLPFLKKKLNIQNAINTKLDFNMSMLRSDKIGATESNTYTVNGGFDYRFSKNFVFNSNISYTIYRNLDEIRYDYREFKITFGGNIVF